MEFIFHGEAKVGRNKKRKFTAIGVIDVNENVLHWDYSRCSEKDNFLKKKGRLIAGGRVRKYRELMKKGMTPNRQAYSLEIPADIQVVDTGECKRKISYLFVSSVKKTMGVE